MKKGLMKTLVNPNYAETKAGEAEENEVIMIDAPEGHGLAGHVEVVWWRDGTLTFEFASAESVPSVNVFRMELAHDGFEVQLMVGD